MIRKKALTPKFRKTVLSNGVRVLTESHPLSRAVSCGIWVDRGTRDEVEAEQGLAHFIEHMVFKRTKSRNAYEIARDMEAVGGDLNAYTSRESTCFVTHSLKEHVGLSVDVLSDLVCRPVFDSTDIQKEKQVVIQEIHMSEDQLEDSIFDRFFEMVYPDSPLGKSILGSVKSIEQMKRDTILNFHARQYREDNIIVSAAGNLEHEHVVDLVEKFLKWPRGQRRDVKGRISIASPQSRQAPKFQPFREVIKKPSEQAHVLIGLPASGFNDRLRFESVIVNAILGGGMTSRLYQTVREDRGLVYAVYSQLVSHTDSGLNLIYAGTEPKNAPTVVELILKEIRKLRKKGVKKADLDMFKTQVKGQILLGADDVDNRCNSLGVNEMVLKKYRSVDEVMRDITRVNLESLQEYLDTYFDEDQLGILLMGALPEQAARTWLKQL